MKTYLVRVNKGHDSDELGVIGMVRAADVGDLFDIMDEWMNPHDCQYFEVRSNGGVFLSDENGLYTSGLFTDQLYNDDKEVSPKPWKTIIELCGGEEQFKAHWKKWKGAEYNHAVASLMRYEAQ